MLRLVAVAIATVGGLFCSLQDAAASCGDYVVVGNPIYGRPAMSSHGMAASATDDQLGMLQSNLSDTGRAPLSPPPCSGPHCGGEKPVTPPAHEVVLRRLAHEQSSHLSCEAERDAASRSERRAFESAVRTLAGYPLEVSHPPQHG